MAILIAAILVLIINIPFGYWRANVKKFSMQWFLAVHTPVPIVVLIRLLSHIGFIWYTYIFLIAAFFIGQWIGGKIRNFHYSKI